MTRSQQLDFYAKVHILKYLLDEKQKIYMDNLFSIIINIYSELLNSKIDFEIMEIDLNLFNNKSLKKINNVYTKQELLGVIQWIKKIYLFENDIILNKNGINSFFSSKNLEISFQKDNLICNFKIVGGLFKYLSYTINNETFFIEEDILFKIKSLYVFLNNIENYYYFEKSFFEIVLI